MGSGYFLKNVEKMVFLIKKAKKNGKNILLHLKFLHGNSMFMSGKV